MTRVLLRLPAAALVLLCWAYVLYGFGAGYLSPIALPIPANVVVTVSLAAAVLFSTYRYVTSPIR